MTLFIRKTGDEKFEQFVPEGQTPSGFEKFKVQEFILSLSEKKGVWTTLELQYECQEQGFKDRTIKRSISNLTQSGRLIRISRGEYELKP
jgi:predicted transcriptional regulator of viral defense system